jgi:hypothetical protein
MPIPTRATAEKIKRLIDRTDGVGSPYPSRGGVSSRIPVMVRCDSATAADESGVGAQCYSATVLDLNSLDTTQADGAEVWLTVLGDDAVPVVPTVGATYLGLFAGQVDGEASGTMRPRVFADFTGGGTAYVPPSGTHDSECDILGSTWQDDSASPAYIGPLAAGTYLFTSSIIGAILLADTSDDGSQAQILARYDRRSTDGANEVQTVVMNAASTAGNLQLTVSGPDGPFVTTANIPYSATDATYLASINSALDTATGTVGGIVATAIAATDTDLGFVLTYSGAGFAGRTCPLASVAVYPTGSTSATVTRTTTGGSQTYGDFLVVHGTYNATLANQRGEPENEQRYVGSGPMTAIITAAEGDKVYLQFKSQGTNISIPSLTAVIHLAEIVDGYGVGGVARTCWHRLD